MYGEYLELCLKGERFCAYPYSGVPNSLWNIYPTRGIRLGRVMRILCGLKLDRVLLKKVEFPLLRYGVSEAQFCRFVSCGVGCNAIDIAFAWPSPERSSDRIYAYAMDKGNGELIGYIKIATSQREIERLSREYSVLVELDRRIPHKKFEFPSAKGITSFTGDIEACLFQPLPVDAPRWVRWTKDSWDRDIVPIKEEISAGTYRHISREDAYRLDWVMRFLAKATRRQKESLSSALENGLDVCATHGDMACQNFRKYKGRYWLFDWEEFTMEGPIRADELSFRLSTYVYDMGLTFRESVPKMPKRDFIVAAAFQIANEMSFKKELAELLDGGMT